MRRVSLLELVGDAPAVAMLGMCKNAGKTTALTHLVREYARAGVPLALTSIGRDGESRDLVTGTEKPPIFLYQGMLAATAEQLLGLCDVSREILAVTDIHTSLGRVVIFRARSDGFVQLAGPAMVEQLAPLRRELMALGADRFLIDGALSRRSPAVGVSDGACVLSTGASLDRDMPSVAAETAFAAALLTLPRLAGVARYPARFAVLRGEDAASCETPEELLSVLKGGGERLVSLSGALTERQASGLLRSGAPLEGLTLLAEDGSRFLLRRETFEKLRLRGARFRARSGARLAAVTANPVSAGGWRFDREAFLEALRRTCSVPVLDLGRAEWN